LHSKQRKNRQHRNGKTAAKALPDFLLFPLLALKTKDKARIIVLQAGQYLLAEALINFVGIGDVCIDIGTDIYHSLSFGPSDNRIAAPLLNLGNDLERYLGTIGQAKSHIFNIGDALSFILRISHHYSDIVSATLDSLYLLTVETLANLPGKVGKGQPKHSALLI